jgi:predicted acetyltransferase
LDQVREQSGLNKLPEVLGAEAWRRFAAVNDYIERLHPQEVPEPHWYLMLIAVDSPRQGQGMGGALLKLILDRADRDGVPAYLWTVQPKNVPFYKRYGFRIVTESAEPVAACASGHVNVTPMQRDAVGADGRSEDWRATFEEAASVVQESEHAGHIKLTL